MTIGASIMPLVNMSDQVIVVNRLVPIIDKIPNIPYSLESFMEFAIEKGAQIPAGLTLENMAALMPEVYTEYVKMIATQLYGILTGGVNTLINFPAVLTIALAMSLVPAISESYALKDMRGVANTTTLGIRLTLLVGVPAAVGLGVLAEPILRALYNLEEWEYLYGSQLLMTLCVGVVFLTLVQSLTAMLQGVGKQGIPVRNLFIGALFKVVITFVLVAIPRWNIEGAAIGTVVCYGVAALLNFLSVMKYTGVRVSVREFFVKPIISVTVMGIAVHYAYRILFAQTSSNIISLALSIVIGVVVYGIMLLVTKAITAEDLENIPKGRSMARVLKRLGLMK